ncbi:MAG: hypothetical protein KBT53_03070 [Porticoccus sp.]|nr:hypothetical protein [Porticoccus sp.]MBQ0807407.1 hypothetical protein [Porticoccus sp.]
MKVLKKTDDYTVYQKRSGRYGVIGADGNPINGEDKVKILLAEGMVKQSVAAAPEPEVVEEAVAEEVVEEAAAEEPAAEEAPAPEVAEEPAAEEAPAEEAPETKE